MLSNFRALELNPPPLYKEHLEGWWNTLWHPCSNISGKALSTLWLCHCWSSAVLGGGGSSLTCWGIFESAIHRSTALRPIAERSALGLRCQRIQTSAKGRQVCPAGFILSYKKTMAKSGCRNIFDDDSHKTMTMRHRSHQWKMLVVELTVASSKP